MMSDTLTMNIDQITVNGNVRHELRLDDPFVASIKEHGIIQPLIVNDGVLVAGHRRLAAAEQLGLSEVPIVLMDLDPEDVRAIQLVENVHRNDLTPLELAQAVWDMKVDDEYTQPMIEDATGMSRTVVSELQKIGKAIASDELMTDERLLVANQMSLEGLVDLAAVDDVPVSDVLRVFGENVGDFYNSIRSASSSARSEIAAAEFIDGLTDDLKAWSEAGIEVTYTKPNLKDELDEWGRAKVDRKYQTLGSFEHQVDIDKHIELECHVIEVFISDGHTKSYVAHWCKDFKRHEAKGKSDLKHEAADRVEKRKVDNSTVNREMRDAKKLRVLQAQAWFKGGKVGKASTTDLAVAEAGDHLGYDNAKLFARDILGLTPPEGVKGMDANTWYNQQASDWFDAHAEVETDQRSRLIVAAKMALTHIASSSTKVYNWYAPWLVEMDAIEVADADE